MVLNAAYTRVNTAHSGGINKVKIGFIGCGNMAQAIISGLVDNRMFEPDEIIASDKNSAALARAKEKYGIHTTANNSELVLESEVLLLAVKPQVLPDVISEIADTVGEQKLVISIVAGQSISHIRDMFGRDIKIIRTMPNTPALVGEGMTAMCHGNNVTEVEARYAAKILGSFGKVEIVPENIMDAVVAVSGSSPAYVAMLIEAMADAAVLKGMARPQAYRFAAQAVYGTAKLIMETGKHPAEIKDMVCSPAGTTIEAVRILEEKGFRSSVIEAMSACAEVSSRL